MNNQSKKKHCCPHEDCGARFDRPFKLAQHVLKHNDVKSHFCTEENCSKSYTTKSHLDRHINSVHKDTDNYVLYSCPKCLKKFANRQNVKRHIKTTHTEKIFLCDICNMTFRKKNLLSAHMYQHTGIKSFSCEICSNDFISLYEKKRHLRFHKTHNCNECHMKFNHWSKYIKHRKMHNAEKEYICNECNRHFNQRTHLVRHIKDHMKSDVKKRFPCSYPSCSRVYSRRSNLKQHIIVKHEKLRHECNICGAQLSTKAKLKHHIELHKNPREFKPKTLSTGRKERKDKGSFKTSTALQLAGILERPSDISETFETLEIMVT